MSPCVWNKWFGLIFCHPTAQFLSCCKVIMSHLNHPIYICNNAIITQNSPRAKMGQGIFLMPPIYLFPMKKQLLSLSKIKLH